MRPLEWAPRGYLTESLQKVCPIVNLAKYRQTTATQPAALDNHIYEYYIMAKHKRTREEEWI